MSEVVYARQRGERFKLLLDYAVEGKIGLDHGKLKQSIEAWVSAPRPLHASRHIYSNTPANPMHSQAAGCLLPILSCLTRFPLPSLTITPACDYLRSSLLV